MRPVDALARIASAAIEHPRIASRLSRVLEDLGAHTLADQLDRVRSAGDLVPIHVPIHPRALRSHRFKMYSLQGRDQVVRAMRHGGWLSFEPPLPSVVVQLTRRWPTTFLDVGANTGLYSLIAVSSHRDARAIAFEPLPAVAEILRANVEVNGQQDRIQVVESAISDHDGVAALHLPPVQPDGTIETSASLDPTFKRTLEGAVQVQVRTLDSAWRAAGRPLARLIKVDVEGAEHRVLAGASELIAACRPTIAVEVLSAPGARRLEAARRALGYVDIALSPVEAVVNRPVRKEKQAPNHLLVPFEVLDVVVDELRELDDLLITLLD